MVSTLMSARRPARSQRMMMCRAELQDVDKVCAPSPTLSHRLAQYHLDPPPNAWAQCIHTRVLLLGAEAVHAAPLLLSSACSIHTCRPSV
jgi:hypothetical protein